jgi:hypothetical protein|nr:MAG TPA: hypothetical protein [Caudoviricetes sp.]
MGIVKRLLFLIIPYIILSLLAGCKSVQYVPVETVRTDSIYVDRYQRDSIYQRDSVFVNRWIAGDTIYQDKVVWKYVYRDKVKYDTVAILRSDTVRVPYPVERRLTTWEQVRLNVGGWAIGAVIIFILIVVGIIVYKLKQCN